MRSACTGRCPTVHRQQNRGHAGRSRRVRSSSPILRHVRLEAASGSRSSPGLRAWQSAQRSLPGTALTRSCSARSLRAWWRLLWEAMLPRVGGGGCDAVEGKDARVVDGRQPRPCGELEKEKRSRRLPARRCGDGDGSRDRDSTLQGARRHAHSPSSGEFCRRSLTRNERPGPRGAAGIGPVCEKEARCAVAPWLHADAARWLVETETAVRLFSVQCSMEESTSQTLD